MTNATSDHETDEEPGRPKGMVALADETPDELPALLAIAVGVVVLVIGLLWPRISQGTDDEVAVVVTTTTTVAETTTTEAAAPEDTGLTRPDLDGFEAELGALGLAGIALTADGNVVTATGEVPDEAAREQVITYLASQPKVESVIDQLTIAAPVQSEVDVTAAQAQIVLEGTVPDEETRQILVERAVSVYSDAQVVDNLVVDADRPGPVRIRVSGELTDPVLYNQVVAAFGSIEGFETEFDDSSFLLVDSGELESTLNSLEPVQFASGSALINAESAAILDEAAAALNAEPGTAVEIGGHTDSQGGDEANQQLSQARADAVKAALEERDVTNELTAVGFGERRLINDPDDTPEKRQENRRIEFRVLN